MELADVRVQNAIAERLRNERERLGLKPEEFAARVGMHRSTLFNYEAGTRVPDAALLMQMHALAAVDVLYLLTGRRERMTEELTADERALLDRRNMLPTEMCAVVDQVLEWALTTCQHQSHERLSRDVNLSVSIAPLPTGAVKQRAARIARKRT